MADDTGERPTLRDVTEWTGGFSWIADPDERGRRASHALATDAGVWLVDPVDADGLDDRVAEPGEVAGVVVLHDRHRRDASTVARRHDVAVHVPDWMGEVAGAIDRPVDRLDDRLPGTDYEVHRLIDTEDWQEAILVDETTDTLVVPEGVGTLPSFGDDDGLGVHPSLTEPPRRLLDWRPDRVLVGHGGSVHRDATAQLRAALDAT